MRKDKNGESAAKVREWLIQIREAKGLTQGAVANAAGIAQPSYFEIEKGISTPRPETAMKIAAAIGFHWTRFYEEEEKSVNVDAFWKGGGTGE